MITVAVQVFQIRVLLGVANGRPCGEGFGDRSAHRALDHHAIGIIGYIKLSKFHVEVTLDTVEGRRIGNKVHQAACRVTTKQGALRALQNFDSSDIEDGEGLCLSDSNVSLIQIDRIGCFDDVVEIVLRHAANRELGILSR